MTDLDAVVYTSKHGHTARYAGMLGKILDRPVLTLEDALSSPPGKRILYLGWVRASSIVGYKKAAKQFEIPVVCGVGLAETGTQLEEVRKASAVPEGVQLYTLQGGMDRSVLKGMDKFIISLLEKALASKKNPSEGDRKTLELLRSDRDYVSLIHLAALLEGIGAEKK